MKKTKKQKSLSPKKKAEEIPDQDELQALDEANEPWVEAWRESVRKTRGADK